MIHSNSNSNSNLGKKTKTAFTLVLVIKYAGCLAILCYSFFFNRVTNFSGNQRLQAPASYNIASYSYNAANQEWSSLGMKQSALQNEQSSSYLIEVNNSTDLLSDSNDLLSDSTDLDYESDDDLTVAYIYGIPFGKHSLSLKDVSNPWNSRFQNFKTLSAKPKPKPKLSITNFSQSAPYNRNVWNYLFPNNYFNSSNPDGFYSLTRDPFSPNFYMKDFKPDNVWQSIFVFKPRLRNFHVLQLPMISIGYAPSNWNYLDDCPLDYTDKFEVYSKDDVELYPGVIITEIEDSQSSLDVINSPVLSSAEVIGKNKPHICRRIVSAVALAFRIVGFGIA